MYDSTSNSKIFVIEAPTAAIYIPIPMIGMLFLSIIIYVWYENFFTY